MTTNTADTAADGQPPAITAELVLQHTSVQRAVADRLVTYALYRMGGASPIRAAVDEMGQSNTTANNYERWWKNFCSIVGIRYVPHRNVFDRDQPRGWRPD